MTAVQPDMTAAVCLFRGLADPARLAIVRHLALGEHRVVELTAHLGLAHLLEATGDAVALCPAYGTDRA